MLHAKAMTVVVAYDVYLECAEGNLDESWKVSNPVDFYTFRETLSRQMMAYDPKKNKYLGDDKFRDFTKQTKAKRARSPAPPPLVPPLAAVGDFTITAAGVTAETYMACKTSANHVARLSCGFIGELTEHYDSCSAMDDKGKKLKCAFCGKPSYQFCGLCGVAVHKFPQDNVGDGLTSCFFLYHDAGCFGLARDDWKITNKKKMKDWSYPTMADRKTNEEQMRRLSDQVAKGPNAGGNGVRAVANGVDNSDSDDE
jgi:hypothetical protein